MLFGYSGSSRPDKTRRQSFPASVASHSSNSNKGSNSATERPYKAHPGSHSRGPSTQSAGKTSGTAAASSDKLVAAERKMPGVFDFLEEDGSEESSSSSESDEDDVRGPSSLSKSQPKPTTAPATVGLQLARNTTTSRRSTLQNHHNETGPSTARPAISQDKKGTDYYTTPEAYYPTVRKPALPPSPPKSPEEQKSSKSNQTSRRNIKSLDVSSGYGFIASRLSTPLPGDDGAHHQLPPLYRRFEHLNHRVLLHLQDEIAQMEEELHLLDEYEEMHRSVTADQEGKSKPTPASRRMDAQAQTYSNLHYRRNELMGSIISKTEQYNNALCAYSKVLESLPRASGQDIEFYRAWIKAHNPLTVAESRFLDHDPDLISITPRHPSPSLNATIAASTNNTSPFPVIVIVSTAILLPLLAFSMISEFSGRLLVVTIVASAVSAVASNSSTGIERLIDAKDGWKCAGIYFGFMAVAAMFIP